MRRCDRDRAPLCAEDQLEVNKFVRFVRDLAPGKPQGVAYAEHYGETIFEAKTEQQP